MKHQELPLPTCPQGAGLIDTHCHLDMEAYKPDLEEVLCDAIQHGVQRIITIGIDQTSSKQAVRLAEKHASIFATIGYHPHDARQATAHNLQQTAELASHPRVVGYGEIGLDYVKNHAPRDLQLKVFAEQLGLAKELGLPVVVHDREAHADVLQLIRAAGPLPRGGVMHCFSGDLKLAQEMIDLGFLISIPGVITFSSAHALREVVQGIDLEYLLLETDGPFLAPVPFRGKRNEPKRLLYTAQKVAELKQITLDEVATGTTANATRLFHLPEAPHVP